MHLNDLSRGRDNIHKWRANRNIEGGYLSYFVAYWSNVKLMILIGGDDIWFDRTQKG
jgi:hypothetical protein